MRFTGTVGEHEPDPRDEWRAQARRMPVPFFGLVPQRHVEDWGALGGGAETRDGALTACEVSISYTLWRNPDDPDDPANLADLDDERRRAVETQPPWPRPQWLVEQVRRMRYPALWECVRTRWCRDPGPYDTVRAALVDHVNHVVVNQFRQTRAAGDHPPHTPDSPVTERCAEPAIPIPVDGTARDGIRIDTDPDVYGLGVQLDPHTTLTAAVPRDALPYLDLSFARHALDPA